MIYTYHHIVHLKLLYFNYISNIFSWIFIIILWSLFLEKHKKYLWINVKKKKPKNPSSGVGVLWNLNLWRGTQLSNRGSPGMQTHSSSSYCWVFSTGNSRRAAGPGPRSCLGKPFAASTALTAELPWSLTWAHKSEEGKWEKQGANPAWFFYGHMLLLLPQEACLLEDQHRWMVKRKCITGALPPPLHPRLPRCQQLAGPLFSSSWDSAIEKA